MYGENSRLRYLIGFGLVALLLIVVIILILTSGGHKPPVAKQALASYAGDSSVTVSETIIGPITAAQNHAEATIDITNQSTSVTKYQGYGQQNEIGSDIYPMSQTSFTEFLAALDQAGFTKGNTDPSLANDQGYCAIGERYIFTLMQGPNTLERFWATNCGGTKTYRGNLSLTLTLFQNQVPDYGTLISGIQNNNSALAL